MTFLLDLNLLLALAWPSHVHHDVAHAWFEREASPGWATCPLTQLGFVRLSSNPAFTSDAVSPPEALSLLQAITAMDGHEFWPDHVDCVSASFVDGLRITGHRQVTDAYLLSLARERPGCLATLDRQIGWLLPRNDRPSPHLRIVETR
ncbi:MAG: VapC toxin family PIN domain ribonuclease [Boseongicola sp. SB0662_bin_57]|nr:VapC toxin family PIN domain ribonuclease [Boseongicola sp. SB0662_bin_57]